MSGRVINTVVNGRIAAESPPALPAQGGLGNIVGQERVYLAVDLGASSGRVVAGLFDGQRLALEECHRFENGGVPANGRLYWDLLGQWQDIQNGLRSAAARYGDRLVSVGVDTWGVDFGFLGRGDELLGNPFHYRDTHTEGYPERAFATVSREKIFAETGLQFLPFNSLYQLLALQQAGSPLLEHAETFLMMPDLFHWLLTGVKSNEYTNSTTTQLYNPLRGTWSAELLRAFGLPASLFGEIQPPGTSLGSVRTQVREATGLGAIDVVLPGTHDTASAVMAVPADTPTERHPTWCYLSSGTWSLMGVELPAAIINETSRRYNFTNEGGVGGTVRLLKNIAGLWLLQECRRIWQLAGHDYTWEAMIREAQQVEPARSLIDPDHASLLAPRDMPAAIQQACRKTGQPVPETPGQIVRCALDSLALRYRAVLGWLEEMTGGTIEVIHVVGGGVQNRLLCQMTADACDRQVVAGPVEATALGNLMMQAVSFHDVANIAQAREVIRHSFPVDHYEPTSPREWDEPWRRFQEIVRMMAQQ
jgi:rhamnulokinase